MGADLERRTLFFTAPGCVSIEGERIEQPGPGEVLVHSLFSAISPGTERRIYRGDFPKDQPVDSVLKGLAGTFQYPLKYGYSLVGEVTQLGEGVDSRWSGRRVFAFHPHESHFITPPEALFPIPGDIPSEDAVFLPNMETAVNFVMDGSPVIGERVVVFGQGIVGLLTTALLVRFPLERLVTLDPYPMRRQASLDLGVNASLNPADSDTINKIRQEMEGGVDLVFELSGAAQALNQAIALAGFDGRIVIGSYYGESPIQLELDWTFHRNRIRLISSQVSSLASNLRGRWSKERRFAVVWNMLRQVAPARFITHTFPIDEAEQAFQLIDRNPEESIQVIFTYE